MHILGLRHPLWKTFQRAEQNESEQDLIPVLSARAGDSLLRTWKELATSQGTSSPVFLKACGVA